MEITTSPLEWTSDDVVNFRAFLRTQTGQRLVPKIVESAPALLPSGSMNEILIRSGEVRGVQSVVHTILSLVNPVDDTKQNSSDHFPDLVDDNAWNDGKKIEVNPPSPESKPITPYGLVLNTKSQPPTE